MGLFTIAARSTHVIFVPRRICLPQLVRYMCTASIKEKEIHQTPEVDPNTNAQVLDFFNRCDYVTLKKLITLKPALFQNVSAHEIMQSGDKLSRFKTVNEVKKLIYWDDEKLLKVDKLISQLEKKEASSLVITNLKPKLRLPKSAGKLIDKVVVVDVFQREVAWCEQCTQTREVRNLGYEKLFGENFNFRYNHVDHHKKIMNVIEKIPDSKLYLLNSSGRAKIASHGKGVKYAIHQSIMEALFVTMLNNRASLATQRFKQEASELTNNEMLHKDMQLDSSVPDMECKVHTVSADSETRGTSSNNLMSDQGKNYVHLFELKSFGDFYDLMIGGELKAECSKFVQEWYGKVDGPLHGMYLKEGRLYGLTKEESVAKCILMSDLFCRNIQKHGKQFPRAYSDFSSSIPTEQVYTGRI